GVDHIAGMDFGHVIVAPDLIVDAAWHNRAVQSRAPHLAPENRHDAARAMRCRADVDRWADFGTQVGHEGQAGGCDVAHGALSSPADAAARLHLPAPAG